MSGPEFVEELERMTLEELYRRRDEFLEIMAIVEGAKPRSADPPVMFIQKRPVKFREFEFSAGPAYRLNFTKARRRFLGMPGFWVSLWRRICRTLC